MKGKVVFFQRKQRPLGNFSVEIYFRQVRENLPADIEYEVITMPFESNGLFKRFANAVYCIFKQGDINHITGDIHYVASFLKKSKTILTILDCGLFHQASGIKRKIFKIFWFDIPILKSKIVTAISKATKDDVLGITKCNPEKIRVIYFLSNSSFKKSPKEFNAKNPNLLQIGTAPNKNIPMLIKAIKGIQCNLSIVGKVDENIMAMLAENQITHKIYDYRLTDEEIEELYKECDIVAFASTLEGFGMPIIEGNTIGRAVITSNISSMPEVAANAAILVDPYDVSSIRTGILKTIDDNKYREQIIQNGYKNVERFKPSTIASEYADLYKEVYTNCS